ncbi:protein phosphatase type 2C, partial [Reticulomyxa filosa]
DHSPDSSVEYLRIKELPTSEYPLKLLFVYDQANVTKKYECPLVFLENGTKDPKYVKNPWGYNLRPTNVRYDPAVYAVSPFGVTNDVTCIAMTRSLGDFYAHQFGLSHQPDITFCDVDCNDEYLVTIGSDGIWDCWKWEAFADYINGNLTKMRIQTDKVVQTALRHTVTRAKSCFGDTSFDDTSLIVVALVPELFPPIEEVYPSDLKAIPSLTTETTGDVNMKQHNNSCDGSTTSHEESKDSLNTADCRNTTISDQISSDSSTVTQTDASNTIVNTSINTNVNNECAKSNHEKDKNDKVQPHTAEHVNSPACTHHHQEGSAITEDTSVVTPTKTT